MKRFDPQRNFAMPTVLLLLLVWAAPFAAAQDGYREWRDPQVTFSVPADWYVSETTWVAERLIFATPKRVDPNRLLLGEVAVDALVQVKIDALDAELAQLPLAELIRDLETRYRQATGGSRYSVRQMGLTQIDGKEGAILVTEQDGFIDHSLLIRSAEYLYEVRVAYRRTQRFLYETLPEQVLQSLRLPALPQAWETRRRDTFLAALDLPPSWHMRSIEGTTPAVFLTEEPLYESLEVQTGVSLIKVHNYAVAFGLTSPDAGAAYRFWLQRLLGEFEQGAAYRLLNVAEIVVGGVPSLYIELSYEKPASGEHVQLINVSTALDGHFYNATFEAPVRRFYALRPMYLAAVRSLRWK